MNYNINPCGICQHNYKPPEYKVDKVNSCIAETTAAFLGYPSNDIIDGKYYTNVKDCIQNTVNSRVEKIHRNKLNPQISPVFVQSPHHFPKLLDKTKNINKSLDMCNLECDKNKYLPNECKLNCYIDANSVFEVKEKFDDSRENNIKTSKDLTGGKGKWVDNKAKDEDISNSFYEIIKKHPIIFFFSFFIYNILLICVTYLVIKLMFVNFTNK